MDLKALIKERLDKIEKKKEMRRVIMFNIFRVDIGEKLIWKRNPNYILGQKHGLKRESTH